MRVALHGGRAVTASLDGTVRIHDVKTGSEIRIRDEHDVGDGDGAASADPRTRPNGGGSSRGRVVRHPASFASHPASFTSPSARALPGGFGRRRRGGDERRFRHRVRRLARREDASHAFRPRAGGVRRGWAPVGSWRDSPTARRRREPSPTAASSREDASLDHHRPCVTSSGVWKFTRSRGTPPPSRAPKWWRGNSNETTTKTTTTPSATPEGGMPDRAPRGGAFPVDATLRGSRRTRAMRVFRVASSSRGWNLARRGGHRRRRRDDSRVRPRHRSMPPRDGGPTGNHRGGTRGSSARRVDVSPPAGNHVRRRVGRTGGGGSRRRKRAGVDQRARRTSPTTKGTRTKTTKTTKTAETTVPSERVPTRRARWRRWFVNSPARAGSVVPAPTRLKAKAKAKARPRPRPRVLVPVPVPVPVPVARASSSSPTGCVPSMVAALRRGDGRGGEGRTCRFRVRGRGMPRPPAPGGTCSRARAHLAAENRAWAARASAAARSEARTEEHAHESLEASASWARTRAGGSTCSGSTEARLGGSPRSSCPWRTGTRTWRGARGSAAAAAAAAESWRVADLLSGGAVSAAADVTYAATHAAADRAWTTGVRPAVSAASAAASMAAETAAVAERLGREAARAAGARIVGHVGQFAPSRGLTFREHNAAAWCVAADRETLVTGDADGNVFARYFGPPEEPRFEWR